MTDVSERRCCASIRKVLHVCESAGVACITQLHDFHINCLSLSVIQLDFYEQHEKQQQLLPKPIHESVLCFLIFHFSMYMYLDLLSVDLIFTPRALRSSRSVEEYMRTM